MEGVHETLLPTDDEEITVCSESENSDSSDCDDETVSNSDPMPTFNREHTDRISGTRHYTDTRSTYGEEACVYEHNNTYDASKQEHTVLGHKSSKEQRAKINLRERKRMHDLNGAMESLREVMPYGCGPTVRKLSKIATLSVARNYIIMLNRTVAELKQKLEHVYRSQYVGPTAHRQQSTGLHSYGSRFGFSQTNTNASLGYGIPDIHNHCQLGSEPLPIQCANRLSVPGGGVVKCQCCMTSSSGWFRVNGNSLSSNTMSSFTSSNLRR